MMTPHPRSRGRPCGSWAVPLPPACTPAPSALPLARRAPTSTSARSGAPPKGMVGPRAPSQPGRPPIFATRTVAWRAWGTSRGGRADRGLPAGVAGCFSTGGGAGCALAIPLPEGYPRVATEQICQNGAFAGQRMRWMPACSLHPPDQVEVSRFSDSTTLRCSDSKSIRSGGAGWRRTRRLVGVLAEAGDDLADAAAVSGVDLVAGPRAPPASTQPHHPPRRRGARRPGSMVRSAATTEGACVFVRAGLSTGSRQSPKERDGGSVSTPGDPARHHTEVRVGPPRTSCRVEAAAEFALWRGRSQSPQPDASHPSSKTRGDRRRA